MQADYVVERDEGWVLRGPRVEVLKEQRRLTKLGQRVLRAIYTDNTEAAEDSAATTRSEEGL